MKTHFWNRASQNGRKLLKVLAYILVIYLAGAFVFQDSFPPSTPPSHINPQGIVIFTGSKARILEGFQLLHTYPNSRLLISGVNPQTTLDELIEAAAPPHTPEKARITMGYGALDTVGNAQETADWTRKFNIQRIVLVTSNDHMLRSLLELKHAAPLLAVTPHAVTAESFKDNTWWQKSEFIIRVFSEYTKYMLAWVKYKIEDKA